MNRLLPLDTGYNRYIRGNGYVILKEPTKNSRHIYEHRYIMSKHLGRELKRNEHVHHINGIRHDNRIENLAVLSASDHVTIQNREINYAFPRVNVPVSPGQKSFI